MAPPHRRGQAGDSPLASHDPGVGDLDAVLDLDDVFRRLDREAGFLDETLTPCTVPRAPVHGSPEPVVRRRLDLVVTDGDNEPPAWPKPAMNSSQDEFVFVVSGEVTLVTDAGRQVLGAGMVAGFPAGTADGHHLVNASAAPAVYLEVGDRRSEDDEVRYPDIDMVLTPAGDGRVFRHNDGRPYDVD